jgi:multiple sugar transport system ATP-binding protein
VTELGHHKSGGVVQWKHRLGLTIVASVSYEHVSKRFDDESIAVNDFNLEIKDTEFMVLVGPSGCGKSTALRMLAGLEDVTEGVIRIGERVVNDVSARDRDVAMVFQSYALYPHMDVYNNMAFGLKMRGLARAEIDRRVNDTAKILELGPLLRRKPRQLSGGQRQRVALGRAIVREPQVFLLDEPLSNLDAKLRVQTRIELQKQHRALHATFIYVTHDQVEAMTMGDRIAVMRGGVLQQVAPPREIYDNPANSYVAGFIGSPSMNFIPVTIQGTTARASGFEIELPSAPGIEKGLLGIRPEALTEHPRDDHGGLDLKVDVVEVLGADQFLYGRVGGDAITARVDPDLKVAPGDRIRLVVSTRRIHLFDPVTEMKVL